MSVGSAIRRIRREKGKTLEEVAAAIGTDSGNLSRLERDRQGYTDAGLKQLAKALGVKVSAFFEEPTKPLQPVGQQTYIPVSSLRASAGLGVAQPEYEYIVGTMQLSETWLRSQLHIANPAQLGILSAYGDSMAPTFNDGDVLLVDRAVDAIRLDAIYVIEVNGELFVKRVVRRMDGSVVIKSDNQLYDPHVLSNEEKDSLRVLGRVVWAWNGRKL